MRKLVRIRWRCGSDNTYIHMIESTQRTAVSPTASALAVALYSVSDPARVWCNTVTAERCAQRALVRHALGPEGGGAGRGRAGLGGLR